MANVRGLCVVVAAAAASCAAPETTTTAHPAPSGKPGASVSFSHALRAPVAPDGDGVLELTITEQYDAGTLQITAASDGLDLAAASRSTTLSMDGAAQHRWDVYFNAPAGGVYYIDFVVTVEDANGAGATRSYSAAIQVGDNAARAKPDAPMALDAEGDPVVVMEAEETIDE